jgi:plastocyanin
MAVQFHRVRFTFHLSLVVTAIGRKSELMTLRLTARSLPSRYDVTAVGSDLVRRHATSKVAVALCIIIAFAIGCTVHRDVSGARHVHEIQIADDLRPSSITVAPGDEVRWINKQAGPVYIVFLDSILDQLSCHSGFGIGGAANARRIGSDGTLSVCFASAGSVRYTVRLDSPLMTGAMNVLGVIWIENVAGSTPQS